MTKRNSLKIVHPWLTFKYGEGNQKLEVTLDSFLMLLCSSFVFLAHVILGPTTAVSFVFKPLRRSACLAGSFTGDVRISREEPDSFLSFFTANFVYRFPIQSFCFISIHQCVVASKFSTYSLT